jgi:hypothetical protein
MTTLSAETSCMASVAELDKAVGGKFPEPKRAELYASCVAGRGAILRKTSRGV